MSKEDMLTLINSLLDYVRQHPHSKLSQQKRLLATNLGKQYDTTYLTISSKEEEHE